MRRSPSVIRCAEERWRFLILPRPEKSPPHVTFRMGNALAGESRISFADGAEIAGI